MMKSKYALLRGKIIKFSLKSLNVWTTILSLDNDFFHVIWKVKIINIYLSVERYILIVLLDEV